MDPAYINGAAFLQALGLNNQAEASGAHAARHTMHTAAKVGMHTGHLMCQCHIVATGPALPTPQVARILDVAMNPNSLYLTDYSALKAHNSSARTLSVEEDMQVSGVVGCA